MTAPSKFSYIQASVNGSLQDARRMAISPLDRGFLYGDAIYEVWRSYYGVLFAWDEHWQRLENTAEGLGMDLPLGKEAAFREIRRAVAAWREVCGDADAFYVRLQISRGGGDIGLDTALAVDPCFVIYVKALATPDEASLDHGIALTLARRWRRNSIEALPPSLKTGNYLNNIQGLREARERGADDALFLNATGYLTEASTRNLWLVFPDRIATPRLADGILAGVTRRLLLERFPEFEGRSLAEEALGPDALSEAEECFLSSSTQDIQPVRRVDETRYQLGAATVTRRLKAEFAKIAREYAAKRGDLTL